MYERKSHGIALVVTVIKRQGWAYDMTFEVREAGDEKGDILTASSNQWKLLRTK